MAAELDFAALGIREAPRMHLEEEAVVDEVSDSQNSIYNQIAEHERLLARSPSTNACWLHRTGCCCSRLGPSL